MEEIWKDIKNYEGLYQISTLGRVRSFDRIVNSKNGGKQLKIGKILKPIKGEKYLMVDLSVNNRSHFRHIHRLVAEAFIPNPHNYSIINHKDENKLNNVVSNLEWCTQKYNVNYGNSLKQRAESHKKSVIAFDDLHKLGTYFRSVTDAAAYFNGSKSNISIALKNSTKTAFGYTWEYA